MNIIHLPICQECRFDPAVLRLYYLNMLLWPDPHSLWRYFLLPFEDCRKTMKKITKTRRPDQYLERVNLFFETEAQLRQPKADLSA